jgi:two-component system sensor histidine kinase KdpD
MLPEQPPSRPNPDELIARLRRTRSSTDTANPAPDGSAALFGAANAGDGAPPPGHLKIFFGMCPGVGKTYAMLAAAQRMAAQGVDVAVGIAETHGRTETEQMLLGLDILPRRRVTYGGVELREFDADAAIRRRPDILLVDELAHTNAPGSAREKRWQDVRECLRAGINVYTTLNVQHLESLNDVVAQITGVRVGETVPDHVFDEADEIELVDLPPEALHERLRAGKVYLGENAARAVDPGDGFFRRGNLTALRELALRRTAEWVDSDMRRYKQDRGIRAVWPAGERIVVAVSPSPMSGKLVRAAKRMAAGLHADLIAVYVETPRTTHLSASDRARLDANLRLAESLGATTATLSGENAARQLIAFAHARNVSKIVVGKTERPRWKELVLGSFIDNLIRESGDVDIYVVRGDEGPTAAEPAFDASGASAHRRRSGARAAWQIARSAVVVAAAAGLAWLFYRPPDLSDESLILLGGVVVAALWCGRAGAAAASVLAVLAFNFLFTEPRFSLNIYDSGNVLTFGVMLAVGLVVGTLAARSREQSQRASDREQATAAQYALSRELAAAREASDVCRIVARHAHDLLQADVVVCMPVAPAANAPGAQGASRLDTIAAAGSPDWFDDGAGRERGVAQWSFDHARTAGRGTQKLPSSAGRYVPLIGAGGKVGLIGVRLARGDGADGGWSDPETAQALEAIATQAGSALERVALGESHQAARLEAERERLRSALLSSVSHDLRTPLASITGAASALESHSAGTLDDTTRAALLRTIVDESSRLNDIIANLVFATRLESGAVALRREWTTVEEVIGVGLARHREALASRPFRVQVPPDLPMIRVDSAMLPQVVHNLVENALRYTPANTPLGVSAWASQGRVVVKVWDQGPGLADNEASKVFERFYRGRASKAGGAAPAASTGMGLGLTICEGVIRAHGGRIWAEPHSPHGAAFIFSLPVEEPQPVLPQEPDRAEAGAGGAK